MLDDGPRRSDGATGQGRQVLAVILSLVQPGAGHFLVGRFRRGIAWAGGVAGLATLVLFALPMTFVTALAAVLLTPVTHIACAMDTARRESVRPRWAVVLLGWAALIVGSFALEPVKDYYRENYTQAFTIPSASMQDTLLVGDYLLVDRSAYRTRSPRRGDIVVFSYPVDESRNFIFRIVGTPGDTLQLQGPAVLIDGRALDEPYVRRRVSLTEAGTAAPCRYAYGCEALTIPPDSYFVMGDNRDNANDSRFWGLVRGEKIKGKAAEVYWSWDSDRHWLRWWRLGHRIPESGERERR
jgi:signal peptidase I